MTFWIVTADYRPLSERSPGYAFISATGQTAKQTERAFRQRYPVLKNVAVAQMTEDEMEQSPHCRWISWL